MNGFRVVYNKKTLPIVLNRLVSLTAQYGYVIALNLILAKISVNAVLILWLVKLLGDLLATTLNQLIRPIHSAKLFLFLSEVIRALLLLLMPLFFQSYFLFAIVLVFEVLGDIFSSYLMTTIPFLVPKDNLSRFNASITLVGSISYFVGPLLVGIFQSFSQTILFLFYGGLTAIAAILLLILPAISLTPISNEAPNFKKNFRRIGHLFKLYRNYLYVFFAWIILEAVGSSYDSFEVIFLTREVGISNAQYAFALSFLAVAFLMVSSLLTFKKTHLKFDTLFYVGCGFFLSYFALLSSSRAYWQLLVSYVCLAVGSTLIGNMLYNITQTEIATEDQPNIFLLQDVFTNVSSALMVLLLGWGQNVGYSLRPLYQLFFLVALIIVPFLCYRRPKKVVNVQRD